MKREYDKFMNKLISLSLKLQLTDNAIKDYMKYRQDYLILQKKDLNIALAQIKACRSYGNLEVDLLFSNFKEFDSMYCTPINLYIIMDRLVGFKPYFF